MLKKRRQSLIHQGDLLIHGGHHGRARKVKTMTEIKLEAGRHRGLLHARGLNWLRQLPVFVTVHRGIVTFVSDGNLARLPLDIRDILHADVGAASWFLQLDILRLRLLAETLLYLPLHMILKVLYVLSHLRVRRHKVVLLRQLRNVIVLQLIRRRADHVVLLLTEDGAGRVLRYMRDQAIQLGERLIARVAVIMILAFQFAERPATALLRSVKSMRRGGADRRHNRRFCKIEDLSEFQSQIGECEKKRKKTNLLIREHSQKHKTWSRKETNLGARKFAWIARRLEVRVRSAVR